LLTHPALLNFLHRDPENRQNLDYYLNDHFHHFCSWRHIRVDLETSEKILNALEDVDEYILVCPNVLSCLRDIGVILAARRYQEGYALREGHQLRKI
jgi:hypothetical protein